MTLWYCSQTVEFSKITESGHRDAFSIGFTSYLLTLCAVTQVTIGEGSHPENVKVYGPGVEKMGLKANEPTYFTVDCSEAGQGATWSKHLPIHLFYSVTDHINV